MPRPGPRPYECVTRAWHSDEHKPIRGSFIQLIFRVVTQAHSSATSKNREWQEKLPIVVLKAEEIMYSKANSEAEYVDADTLWDRLNDAINTIIRRDESNEIGQFLQPCIEAALVLGCVPVKASRSERHSNPRSYLNLAFQEPSQVSPIVSDKVDNHGHSARPLSPSGNHTNQLGTPMSENPSQASFFSLSDSQMCPLTNYITNQSFPRLIPSFTTDFKSSFNVRSIYPLYYGSHFPNVDPQFRYQSNQRSDSENIIIGRPVSWSRAPPTCFSSMWNCVPGENISVASLKSDQVSQVGIPEKGVEMGCDLSLRLGPSECSINSERHHARVSNDSDSNNYQEISKYADYCTKTLEIPFFPTRHNASDPSESNEKDLFHMNSSLRKRKAGHYHELGDTNSQWL